MGRNEAALGRRYFAPFAAWTFGKVGALGQLSAH